MTKKSDTMLAKIQAFIIQHQLLDHDGHYLVAVSGGADSVCLLLVLQSLGYDVRAVHCNFMLRGEESQRDEDFVRELCQQRTIGLSLTHFDTRTYAALHKVSIEMAARTLRYNYFEQLRQDMGYNDICVAHHRDDSVETVLMNLIRGTGIDGLKGISPRNGHVVRPLLCVTRQEIVEWLEQKQQTFVTDSSNLVADIVRNQLRLDILPRLSTLTPNAAGNIAATARHLSEAKKIYDQAVADALDRLLSHGSLDVSLLMKEPSPQCVLWEWLRTYGFTSATVEAICQALPQHQTGSEWCSVTHSVITHRGRLILDKRQKERPTLRLPEMGTYAYDDATRFRLTMTAGAHIERIAHVACLDADKVSYPLTLRPIRQGDRFQPFGMKGTKLVNDYLTDRHLSLHEKRRQLVVVDATGDILWLVGQRPDGRFCVGPKTVRTLTIEELPVKNHSHLE